MKKAKQILSIFLAVLMVVLAVPVANFAGVNLFPKAQAAYGVGDYIEFGTYPQSLVNDEALISQLDSVDKTWKSYGYYTGISYEDYSGLTHPADYMRYSDFFFNGRKYRAVSFEKYRPSATVYRASEQYVDYEEDFYHISGNNGYYCDNIYYFLYEPIKWRILDPNDGLVMCESIIDSQAYQNMICHSGSYYDSTSAYYQGAFSSKYANDYETSSIRSWLNRDFYETAFSIEQKSLIETSELNNDAVDSEFSSPVTHDKVFLLSWTDIINTSYGFDASYDVDSSKRYASGTDYAKCQGLKVFRNEDGPYSMAYLKSGWLLRTAGVSSFNCCGVGYFGTAYNDYATASINKGIRPACRLSTLESNTSMSDCLFSESSQISENQCGDHVFWRYDESTKCLEIYGSGAMWDFWHVWSNPRTWDSAVWDFEDIQSLVVQEGVERIGEFAFAGHRGLKSVSLPNTLLSIGEEAFAYCFSLTYVKGLQKITIPPNVKAIENEAFVGCEDLEEIVILSKNCQFGKEAQTIPDNENAVIYGYRNSTAEAYATEYERVFVPLDDDHTHTPVTFTQASTCTVPGYTLVTCSECHDQISFESLPLAEHQYGEWVIIKKPTTTETGLRERICTVCGVAKEQEKIPKLEVLTVKDDQSDISVSFDETAYNGDTVELKIEEDFTGSQYLTQSYDKILTWNIKTYVNGAEVQPKAPVTVRIPLPDGFDSNHVAVFHVNSKTGEVERIADAHVEGEYIVFTATSFSAYIVVDESTETDPNACPYCGKVHEGFFGKIVAFFHNIFFRIKSLFVKK